MRCNLQVSRLLMRQRAFALVAVLVAACGVAAGCTSSTEPTKETGHAAHIRPLGNVQLGIALLEIDGTALVERLSVRVEDQFGNPVTGATVTFAVISGGGTIDGGVATSNSNGVAYSGPWTLGSPGEKLVSASVAGLEPVTFTLMAVSRGGLAGLSYELESIAIGSLPPFQLPSRIVFGENGEFTSYVEFTHDEGEDRALLEGHGVYGTFNSIILLRYSGDFLASLRQSGGYWPQYNLPVVDGSPDSDTGAVHDDVIRLFRCWSEDCYDSVWIYRRVAE